MSFTITVEPSGRQFTAAADTPLLGAAIAQNIPLPYGCKDGACGSCKCQKLSGQVRMMDYQSKALNDTEREQGMILTCRAIAESDVVLESRQVGSSDSFVVRKMPARVFSLVEKAPDVRELVLQLPANDVFAFHAGQYIDVLLRDNSRRSYSMAGAPHTVAVPALGETPAAQRIQLHIRHMPGGKFTDTVFGTLKEKDIMRIEGPFGSFYLREGDKPMIFLASGTGFAPIKALIEHLQYAGIERAVHFYWGARRPRDLYMHDWVLEQVDRMPHLHYHPVVSDALAEDTWQGRQGFVHQAVADDFPDLSGFEVYACGAPIVVESAQNLYQSQCGLPRDAFFADSFTSAADTKGAN